MTSGAYFMKNILQNKNKKTQRMLEKVNFSSSSSLFLSLLWPRFFSMHDIREYQPHISINFYFVCPMKQNLNCDDEKCPHLIKWMYVQSNLIEWNALREIISMQFNYREYLFCHAEIYMAAIMSWCIWNGFRKMLCTMLKWSDYQHNQNHCHFALRGKKFQKKHLPLLLAHHDLIRFDSKDSVNIFISIWRPPRWGFVFTCKSFVY